MLAAKTRHSTDSIRLSGELPSFISLATNESLSHLPPDQVLDSSPSSQANQPALWATLSSKVTENVPKNSLQARKPSSHVGASSINGHVISQQHKYLLSLKHHLPAVSPTSPIPSEIALKAGPSQASVPKGFNEASNLREQHANPPASTTSAIPSILHWTRALFTPRTIGANFSRYYCSGRR